MTRKVIITAVAGLMIGSSAARAYEGMVNCKGSDTTECQAQKGQLCVTWMSALEDFIKRQNIARYRYYRDLLNWSSKSVTDTVGDSGVTPSDLSSFLKTLPPDVAARWASNVLQWTRTHGYSQIPDRNVVWTHCGAGTLDFIDNDGSALNPVADDGKMLAR
jgi:hypothetical protein